MTISKYELESADDSLKKDKEFVLAAVRIDGLALKFADDSLKKDKEVVLAALLHSYGEAIRYADDSLKKDKEVVLAAIKQWGAALYYADDSLKKDKEVVLAAVKQDYAHNSTFSGGSVFEFADDSLKKDKEFILAAVEQDGSVLEYVHDSLKKDKEVVLEAVKSLGVALKYADQSLKKDKEFVLKAIKGCSVEEELLYGFVFEFADESLKKDIEIVLKAVEQNGFALDCIDESLKSNKVVVITAVKQALYQAFNINMKNLPISKTDIIEKALEYSVSAAKKFKANRVIQDFIIQNYKEHIKSIETFHYSSRKNNENNFSEEEFQSDFSYEKEVFDELDNAKNFICKICKTDIFIDFNDEKKFIQNIFEFWPHHLVEFKYNILYSIASETMLDSSEFLLSLVKCENYYTSPIWNWSLFPSSYWLDKTYVSAAVSYGGFTKLNFKQYVSPELFSEHEFDDLFGDYPSKTDELPF